MVRPRQMLRDVVDVANIVIEKDNEHRQKYTDRITIG
jgi:hypothetical protein